MELEITGNDLTIENLVRAARAETLRINFSETTLKNMRQGREFVLEVADRGGAVYGLSVGVGSRKTRKVPKQDMVDFNNRMIRDHKTAQGPYLPRDVTRAAAICLINSISAGKTMIRQEVALKFAKRLCEGPPLLGVPMYGGTGVGDVVQLPFLVHDLLGGEQVDVAEGLPLLAQSSFVTAHAAIAFFDAKRLLDELCVVAAMDIEGYAANPSPYNPLCATVRPYQGYRTALKYINLCLEGSSIHTSAPRHLQSPLSFRTCANVLGAAYDAFQFCEDQLSIELNAHQQNPLLLREKKLITTSSHFDMQAVSSALDFVRIALAPVLNSQTERSIKMLQASETGLTAGLEPFQNATAYFSNGLSEVAWTLQGMCTEARTMTQPVSCETCSASQAEGIEDRMNMASLSARKLAEMVSLGFRCAALSTIIGCQAIDLRIERDGLRVGPSLRAAHASVRSYIPGLNVESSPPVAIEVEKFVIALRQSLLFKTLSNGGESKSISSKL